MKKGQHRCPFLFVALDFRSMNTLNKKIIYLLLFFTAIPITAQDITIFFLKNGSIVQGKVLDENNRRVFLKTEEGILKIEPREVIGRESDANDGDLSYLFEKVDYVRDHMEHLSGRMKLWSDSLDVNLKSLNDMIHNIESIQYEYEIDFLRLNSTLKAKSKALAKLEHLVDQSSHKQASISSTLSTTVDSLFTLSDDVLLLETKVKTNGNQSTILTGTVTNLIDDIRDLRRSNQDNRNHIDILTGSLADLIRTMDKVQSKLELHDSLLVKTTSSITDLNNTISDLGDKIDLRHNELILSMEKQFKNSNNTLESVNRQLKDKNSKLSKEIVMLSNSIETLEKRLSKIESDLTKP
ncbi:MAG: hypothetical protein HOF45_07805 [Candidatus Marinimicrobia bacterium]|jgi:chromosome segregation ATPase|nr:hypothetical protein [Candidatus Neomarinimicrobiota bacterium]MBT3937525.1 hypothetical protein [Candidatus Neomarinimicrobiota bacterium]MBT6938244.1 hypothetical protein [Candidatus Neomarinimicrobiota bacterium]MBT7270358.1 hypothetical protein [Candidatus Neomarinimicrobiota bacterium]MBT7900369.1 hypothetical protein [Candidatus Neomarinimicrobiota bacterium]